jgi:hypothetical protein
MEDSFTIKHVSMDYIIHDIMVMTGLNLRPGKQEKDKARIKVLNKKGLQMNTDQIFKKLENLSLSGRSANVVHQPSPEPTGKCSDKSFESETSLYWYPVNNVTMIKIQKVLSFICPPVIIMQNSNNKDIWNNVQQHITSGYRTFNTVSKTVVMNGDKIGDQHDYRYKNDAFDVNTKDGRARIKDACLALTKYINTIIGEIHIKNNSEWVPKIGVMVYSYQPTDTRFNNNPLLLVHLIKMMCDGLEYNVPYPELQEAVSLFIGALKDLEIECYTWTRKAENDNE